MAPPKIGILGQAAPAANTDTAIYTCPAGRRAVISTLVVAETAQAATTVRMNARINGAATGPANSIGRDLDLAAKGRLGFTEGWTLAPGDVLSGLSASGNVTFTAFGEETDVPTA